jgi:uncharacterized protein YbjT (DUF2867 family)
MTGATGYVGRRLMSTLLERGHMVREFVRVIEEDSQDIRIVEVPEIRRVDG